MFQHYSYKVTVGKSTLFIVSMYNPPSITAKDTNTKFMDELAWYISETLKSKNLLILGYFNMQVNQTENSGAQQFINMIEALGIEQCVNVGTHSMETLYTSSLWKSSLILGLWRLLLVNFYLTTDG